MILEKEFNLIIEDGDLLKEETSVANFYRNQKLLAERELDEECVETLKTYMGDTKKPRKMKIDAFIRRATTLNNYLHELFLSDILVPVDYATLAIHQRDDAELKSNRTDPKLSKNYSTETFGRKLLWTKKSEDDNRTRIWVPKSLQKPLLNMIDEASSWPEIAPIKNKKASEIARLVDSNWFCRYPRPLYCLHDNGGEFIGKEYEEMLESYVITSKPTTVKNPQSNGLHERMHLVLCEMLRTQELNVPEYSTADREIDMILQSAALAMRTSTNLITKYSLGQLVFGRDMVIHKSVLADWDLIYAKRRT
mmetsp:Transcript_44137/g.53022  ORF Transcript_44137/g.53022 Transcript_44137/m.53022 type:complete len:308 (-) Transcript_44137:309-1232(-)